MKHRPPREGTTPSKISHIFRCLRLRFPVSGAHLWTTYWRSLRLHLRFNYPSLRVRASSSSGPRPVADFNFGTHCLRGGAIWSFRPYDWKRMIVRKERWPFWKTQRESSDNRISIMGHKHTRYVLKQHQEEAYYAHELWQEGLGSVKTLFNSRSKFPHS